MDAVWDGRPNGSTDEAGVGFENRSMGRGNFGGNVGCPKATNGEYAILGFLDIIKPHCLHCVDRCGLLLQIKWNGLSVYLSLHLFITPVSHAKTAELMDCGYPKMYIR